MYENIKGLRPYFFSLREIDSNVSLDIKFPLSWKYEQIISQYKLVKAKVQDKNDKFNIIGRRVVNNVNQYIMKVERSISDS